MTSKELAIHLGISTSAIRTWTSKNHFGGYFSQSARSTGARRYFSDQDARIMALIVALKNKQKSPDDIHNTLRAYQAKSWRDLPEMPPKVEPVVLPSHDAAEKEAKRQYQALSHDFAMLQDRNEILEGQLRAERAEKARLMQELADVREKLGEATGRLTERLSTLDWMGIYAWIVLAIIIIAAIVIGLVLVVRAN